MNIIFLIVIIILLIYSITVTLLALKRDEKYRKIVQEYYKYLQTLSKTIRYMNSKLKEVDKKGSFESDDEVGFFFKILKEMQNTLNNFVIVEEDTTHEEKK